MKTVAWIDHGVLPPLALPTDIDSALAYLTTALGHVIYERWTWTRLKHQYPALSEAKVDKPVVFRLLIDAPEVIEFWEHGRIRRLPKAQAPSAADILERLLHTHRRRFKPAQDQFPVTNPETVVRQPEYVHASISPQMTQWLERGGRFVNRNGDTNTLAVVTDAQAVSLFLRDKASRSRHTFRAYVTELRRLIRWCEDHHCGPLSDLSRHDLLSYRDRVRGAHTTTLEKGNQIAVTPADKTWGRALAVVASLYQYWFDTGYLSANPAAGLVAGAPSRTLFAPQRFISAELLAACDQWVDEIPINTQNQDISVARRQAIWALYRYSGVRLTELAWSADNGFPRIESDLPTQWTLSVMGKGQKARSIPLPHVCIDVLRDYRAARGLTSEPTGHEQMPLIHGGKGGGLQAAGLYNEVKVIFESVAQKLEQSEPAKAMLLRACSPHWLRHAYAKSLVVDHQVPLPVAQALLGHASVQTTAAYAKTDLSQLREFVEASFAKNGIKN